jgi:uncharacterized phiE125 gp8 family phage protein
MDYIVAGSIAFTDESAGEPVTLEAVKKYLHIGFTDDDELLTDLITAAREWAEKATGVGLKSRTVSCRVHVTGSIELPYGPVTVRPTIITPIYTVRSVTGVVDEYPQTPLANPEYYFTPGPFPRVKGLCGEFDLSYTAGYAVIPVGLKLAVMAKVAADYENRGDQDVSNYEQIANKKASQYKRITQWL